MTVASLVHEDAVRELLDLEVAGSSKYSSQLLGSNIRAASQWLERLTRRILRDEPDLTLKFTTNGAARIILPGLRSVTSVVSNSNTLTVDETYHLIPDAAQTGLYTAIQFRAFNRDRGGESYKAIPDWWDRNLDNWRWYAGPEFGSLPNDLVIRGAWGFTDATMPEVVLDTVKILAAFKTLRPDAFLSGAKVTETGIFDLSKFPIEVQQFIADWRLEVQAVGT